LFPLCYSFWFIEVHSSYYKYHRGVFLEKKVPYEKKLTPDIKTTPIPIWGKSIFSVTRNLPLYPNFRVYAIIVINGFCRLKLVKDHTVGDLPAALPAVSPLKYLFFWYL
jgi:hypothetical protein